MCPRSTFFLVFFLNPSLTSVTVWVAVDTAGGETAGDSGFVPVVRNSEVAMDGVGRLGLVRGNTGVASTGDI